MIQANRGTMATLLVEWKLHTVDPSSMLHVWEAVTRGCALNVQPLPRTEAPLDPALHPHPGTLGRRRLPTLGVALRGNFATVGRNVGSRIPTLMRYGAS